MRITLVPYDPAWPLAFQESREDFLAVIGPDIPVEIEHVGSTSVPGLWAKPIIDIDIVSPAEYHTAIGDALVKSGKYIKQGWDDELERTMFKVAPSDPSTLVGKGSSTQSGYYNTHDPTAPLKRNIYLVAPGILSLRNHLAIRRVLRSRPDLVEEYSQVKKQLSEKEFGHIDEYSYYKTEVAQKILAASGEFTDEEMKKMRGSNLMPGDPGYRPLRLI